MKAKVFFIIIIIILFAGCEKLYVGQSITKSKSGYFHLFFDDFNGGFNTDYFTYDPAQGTPTVSNGKMILPAQETYVYTKKFKIPVTIEGRVRLCGAVDLYYIGIFRKPDTYKNDCIPYGFTFSSTDQTNTLVYKYYWSNPTTKWSESTDSGISKGLIFNFKAVITKNNQKLYINGNLVKEYNDSITTNYWWSLKFANRSNEGTSELDWIKIYTNEWGDFSGLF